MTKRKPRPRKAPRKARGSKRFTVYVSPRLRAEMDDFQEEYAVTWSHWVRVALRARMRVKRDDEEAGPGATP